MSVISWIRLGLLLNIKLQALINGYFIIRSLQYKRACDLENEKKYIYIYIYTMKPKWLRAIYIECSRVLKSVLRAACINPQAYMFYTTYITPTWSRREVSQSHNVCWFVRTLEWKLCHKKRVSLFQFALILNVMVFNKISNNTSILLIIFYNICFNRHMKFYQLVEELNNSLCI